MSYRDLKTVSSLDIEQIRSSIDSAQTNAILDVVLVSDANHDDYERNDLGVGCILGKPLQFAGKSDLTDSMFRPIDTNHTKFPIPGELALVIRTPISDYYLTTLNLKNNINNNIDDVRRRGFTKYIDDENVQQSVIKNSNNLDTSNKISEQFTVDNIPLFATNYGDVNINGRYSNVISLSHTSNQNPSVDIINGSSTIQMYNDLVDYQRLTTTPFNLESERVYNQKDTNTIKLDSDRIILRSVNSGVFVEAKNNIGMVSDEYVTIDSQKDITLNSNSVINLSTDPTDPVIKGNEFSKQWTELIRNLHLFLDTIINDEESQKNSPGLFAASKILKEGINSTIAPSDDLTLSTNKFKSQKVFTS